MGYCDEGVQSLGFEVEGVNTRSAGGVLLRSFIIFFFNDTATTEIYTLALHDALPIYHLEQLVQVPTLGRRD